MESIVPAPEVFGSGSFPSLSFGSPRKETVQNISNMPIASRPPQVREALRKTRKAEDEARRFLRREKIILGPAQTKNEAKVPPLHSYHQTY